MCFCVSCTCLCPIFLHEGQLETLKAENELGQQYFLQLREAKQQIDQANQDKSILTDRLIENEQLISANEVRHPCVSCPYLIFGYFKNHPVEFWNVPL